MLRVPVLLCGFILASAVFAAAQVAPNPARTSDSPATQTARVTNDADTEAMRADLAHMRVLVGQMQRNLGFVDSGLTPLKHQFELEIEMWNVLINDMQRRLNARTGPAPKPTTTTSQ